MSTSNGAGYKCVGAAEQTDHQETDGSKPEHHHASHGARPAERLPPSGALVSLFEAEEGADSHD
jgi:hypothetical protein